MAVNLSTSTVQATDVAVAATATDIVSAPNLGTFATIGNVLIENAEAATRTVLIHQVVDGTPRLRAVASLAAASGGVSATWSNDLARWTLTEGQTLQATVLGAGTPAISVLIDLSTYVVTS